MASQPSTKCLRCGRKLTAAASIVRGYGRTCRAQINAAAKTVDLGDYKAAQQAKAVEVIEQGGVIPTSRPNVFRTASSDGTASYLTAVQACNCLAGLRGRRCYHRAAVQILIAAAPVRRAA